MTDPCGTERVAHFATPKEDCWRSIIKYGWPNACGRHARDGVRRGHLPYRDRRDIGEMLYLVRKQPFVAERSGQEDEVSHTLRV